MLMNKNSTAEQFGTYVAFQHARFTRPDNYLSGP